MHGVFGILPWVSPTQQIIECYTEGPNIRLLSANLDAILVPHEHFWGIEQVGSHILLHLVVLLILHVGAYPKINENGLAVMVDTNILRLDVPMDDVGHLMAVVQRFDHIQEVEPNVVQR